MATRPARANNRRVSKAGRDQSNRAGGDAGGLTFEQALAEIEAIIERIETGEVGLEESLAQYERGVTLVNHCRGKLDRAQQQVEDLTRRLEQADEQDSNEKRPLPGLGGLGSGGERDDSEP